MNAGDQLARLRELGLDPARLAIEPLASHHDRAAFSCGEPALDDYLKTKVGQDLKRRLARCAVLVPEPGNARLLGYYTLSAHTIDLQELGEADRRRLRAYAVLPAILIGRLAVDSGFQGARLGWLLMMHALRACLEISFQAGSVSVVVDALHERAAGFYADLGFAPIGREPLRLHMPIGTVAALFPQQTAALREKWGRPANPFDVIGAERE